MSRLKEPSTWAGVSGAAAALAGAPLAPLMPAQPWLALLSALAGVVAVYLREQSSGGNAPDAPKSDAEASGSE